MTLVKHTRQPSIDKIVVTQLFEGLIVKNPQLRGGRPLLAGTGITVRTIVGHYKLGLTAEDVAAELELDLALVYAALAYYHQHRDEIETDIRQNLNPSFKTKRV